MDRIKLRTLLAIVCAGSLAAATQAAEPAASEHIRYWVVQLGSDDYGTREEATVQLIRAGRSAIDSVVEGALRDDLEVASRSIEVLGSLLAVDDAATADAAADALALVVKAQRGSSADLAAEALGDFQDIREQHAIDDLRRLGGSVLGAPRDGLQVVFGAEWHGSAADLALLKRIPDIERLSVHGVGITDDDLKNIEGLSHLRLVELFGSKVTAAGAARLRQLLPDATFDVRGNAMLGIAGATVQVGQQETRCQITVVQSGSAADRAGLAADDIILKFQDQSIPDFATLTTLIGTRAAGEKVMIELRRGDATLKKEVELGAWK